MKNRRDTLRTIASLAVGLLVLGTLGWLLIPRTETSSNSPENEEADGQPIARPPELVSRPTPPTKSTPRAPKGMDAKPDVDGAKEFLLRGTIVDGSDGSEVSRAWVAGLENENASDGAPERVTTDAGGRFEITLPNGSAAVVAWARGYMPKHVVVQNARPDQSVRIELDRGGSVAGTVLDDLGRPISGARVWCHPAGRVSGWPHDSDAVPRDESSGGETTTDAQGRFRLSGLKPAERYRIRAFKEFYFLQRVMMVKPNDPDIQLTLLLLAGWTVRTVDAENNEPINGASLFTILPPEVRAIAGQMNRVAPNLPKSPGRASGVVARNRDDLPPDAKPVIRLQIVATGYAPGLSEFPLEFGKLSSKEVRLQRTSRDRHPLWLRASFANGGPFSGKLLVRIGPTRVLVTFKKGRSLHPISLPPGEQLLRLEGAGSEGLWWQPAGDAITVNVRGPGTLATAPRLALRGNRVAIDVRMPNGDPARDYGLEVTKGGRGPGWTGHWERRVRKAQRKADGGKKRTLPYVWVRAGRVSVRARIDGVGFAEVTIDASGDGTLSEHVLKLAPTKEFPAHR